MPIQAPPLSSSVPMTPEHLIQARRRLLRYSSLNGVAVTFMMENIFLRRLSTRNAERMDIGMWMRRLARRIEGCIS